MLNFIFGRSGYGKTHFIYSKINEYVNQGKTDIILITPEQFSFFNEYRLLEMLGEEKAGHVQCLSFSRLSNEIRRRYGADGLPVLSKGGKAILMKKAVSSVKDSLILFGKKADSSSFVSSMIEIYDEMKSCNLNGDEILRAGSEMDREVLKNKLSDFAKIISAYDNLIDGKFSDPAETLTKLYTKLNGLGYFKNKIVFFDGFNGFVAQEYKVLETIIEEAENVYFALDTDTFGSSDKYDLFAYVNETASIIKRIAEKRSIPFTVTQCSENKRAKYQDLKLVEKELFSDISEENKLNCENIRIYSASSTTDACDDVARQIKNLLRHGYRASDIAVTMRDKSKYEGVLNSAFEKHGVPYFADERQPVSTQPIMVFALYLIRCISYSYQSSDIFSLIKTGLTDVSDSEDVYLLENYVYTWNINGSDWKKPFERSPRGFAGELTEKDKFELEKINSVREYVISRLIKFQKKVKGAEPKEISKTIFETLKSFCADSHLRDIAVFLNDNNASALASEQARTWDMLMDILNQMAVILPDEPMTMREFYDLFLLVVNTEDLGEIPVGLDNIQVGQADRMRFNNPRAVFILGANEGEFPQTVSGGGLLTETERQVLAEHDFKLYSFGEILNLQERYFAYKACSAPSEKLFVTYTGNTGREESPSSIVTGLLELFDDLKPEKFNYSGSEDLLDTESAAFELMAGQFSNNSPFFQTLRKYFSDDPRFNAVKNVAEDREQNIESKETAQQLFGKNMLVSASRIEDYYTCPYRYFCKFGLSAKPRQKAQINPMARGTLIHYVLEKILSDVGTKKLPLLTDREIHSLVDGAVENYFIENMGNPKDLPKRFMYNFRRLSKMIYDVVKRLAAEFSVCDFEAKAFELSIDDTGAVKPFTVELENGGSLRIHGSIDRVDVLKKDGEQYVRVVDYKSGSKDFRLADIVNGLNLQMFVYLFNLCRDKNCTLSGIPAGVLYMHSSRSVISVDNKAEAEKNIMDKEDKSFAMKGIVFSTGADEIPQAMEHDLAGKYIPVKLDKKGDVKGSLADLEELGLLEEKIYSLMCNMGNSLLEGKVSQYPAFSKSHDKNCEYCDFSSVCSLKKSVPKREYEEISDKQVMDELREEMPQNA